MRRRDASFTLLGVLVSVACSQPPAAVERPLLDGRHEPDVLVEQARLELPPSVGGNRFLRGWFPWPGKSGLVGVVPDAAGAWIEFVQLEARERNLTLRVMADGAPRTAKLELASGTTVAEAPVTPRLRLALPGELGLGRVQARLVFSSTSELGVREARIQPVLDPGEVTFRDGSIRQSPASAVDFVQRFEEGAVLLGSFRPPASAGPEQSFEVQIQAEGEAPVTRFTWSGGEARELRIELPAGDAPLRVRLLASTEEILTDNGIRYQASRDLWEYLPEE